MSGYRRVWAPDHPLANSDGTVLEHRKIMWDAGLLSDPTMVVHHKDRNTFNNSLDNLEAVSPSEHKYVHGVVENQYGEFVVGTGINTQRLKFKESLGQRECEICFADITPMRSDARFCSTLCRNAYHASHRNGT